uniref:Uncharacterized protein n=1 Tax=Meloidogyne enterolobii TaxID=390850 RepID=A0A6V7XNH4_MELEN|nr:unnamed protein product [Meloidogyne enterolobii]
MIWVPTNCTCPSNLKCIRPEMYSKPTFCLPENIPVDKFENYVKNPLEFLTYNCSNTHGAILNAILCIILVSLFIQVSSCALLFFKKWSRRHVTTRRPITRPQLCELRAPTQPSPMVIDSRREKKKAPIFSPRHEETLKKMEVLVSKEAHHSSL